MAKTDSRDFNRIMDGLNEAAAFMRGEADQAKYKVHVPDEINVRSIREQMKLTREAFAVRFGFPTGTVRDWEQGRRKPEASARVLLKMIEKSPGLWRLALNDPDFLKQRVSAYRRQRAVAEGSLKSIKSGTKFFEAKGNEPMHEVTDERREEVERQISMYDELISTYEAPLSVVSSSRGSKASNVNELRAIRVGVSD